MVDIAKLRIGEKVHYQPTFLKDSNRFENGIVKGLSPNGGVFVVYRCGGDWKNFKNYTAENTHPIDLFLGWKMEEIKKDIEYTEFEEVL